VKMLVVVLLLLAGTSAHAIGTYTFVPANPKTNDVVSIRVDVSECLLPHAGVVTLRPDEPAIEVRYFGDDTGCDPSIPANTATPRFQAIGMLPAGVYVTRVYTCGFGPQGTVCDVVANGLLAVQGIAAGARFTVPTLSELGGAGLALVLMLLGGRISRRRARGL
jgi:hypothetical protein